MTNNLSVGFGNTLKFVLLLDSIRVSRTLGGVDQFISKTFSNGLDVTESRFTSTDGQQRDSLVDTTERRNINSLTTNGTLRTDTGRVFTRTTVDDSINEDLKRIGISQQVDDFESVLNNTSSHELLTVVTTSHHQSIG
eukprot:227413_1